MASDFVNFIPEIWSKKTQKNFDQKVVLAKLVNKNYEGEIKNAGDTVHIRAFDDITIDDYTRYGTMALQDLTDPMTDLTIDQAKSFYIGVDDLDKAQMDIDALNGYTERAGVEIANVVDKHLHSLYSSVAASNVISSSGSPTTLTTSNVYGQIVEMGKRMNDSYAPMEGRHLLVNSATLALLQQADVLTHATDKGDSVITRGTVGMVAGFTVHLFQNFNTVSSNTPLLALTSDLITHAGQVAKTEPERPEGTFASRVKGLYLYGSVVPEKHNGQGAVLWVSNA